MMALSNACTKPVASPSHPHLPSSGPERACCIFCFSKSCHRKTTRWTDEASNWKQLSNLCNLGNSRCKWKFRKQGPSCHCRSMFHLDGDSSSNKSNGDKSFGFYLHDLMDQAGIETTHARAARQNFAKVVTKFSSDGKSAKIGECFSLDLARAALEVSAEDDALVSHSAVALPVDSYIERLNSMAIEFAGHHMPTQPATPESVLGCLDNYFYGYKSFQRLPARQLGDARGSYLNMVLTRRLGTPVMLALIYSELVKILRLWGVVDFSVEMEIPTDPADLPRPQIISNLQEGPSKKNKKGFQLLTPESLLVEVGFYNLYLYFFSNFNRFDLFHACSYVQRNLAHRSEHWVISVNTTQQMMTTLKKVYWPWKLLNGSLEGTDFLKAADAANHGISSSVTTSFETLFTAPSNSRGVEFASARAAAHRLQRGIWTSTSFGDMRRALAASERLVLLGVDTRELRDYGVLLYHCGLYEPAFKYLCQYYISKDNSIPVASNMADTQEATALENLLLRLRLILAEQTWSMPTTGSFSGDSLPDPW